MFFPLCKADQENRLVRARAAVEEPDRAREIMDYATAVPEFKKWSQGFVDATMGKSLGNVRSMHSPRHLAGKIQEITYNDAERAIDVVVKVLDPVDWAKVEEGGYTGLSIGGGYLKKWKDGDLTRYTPRIAEISLVDQPCIPGARFLELQKSDGSVSEVMLKGAPRGFAELRPPPSFADLHKAADLNKSIFTVARDFAGRVAAHPATDLASKTLKAGKSVKDGLALAGSVGGLVGGGYAVAAHRHPDGSAPGKKRMAMPSYMTKSEAAAVMDALAKRSSLGRHVKTGATAGYLAGGYLGGKVGGAPGAVLGLAAGAAAGATGGAVSHAIAGRLDQRRQKQARDAPHGAPLSESEHAQRIAAAKARWVKEGHHDLDAHFDTMHAHASKAFLGRDKKRAAVEQSRGNAWHAVADTQAAYDKVRPHLPPKANLMMEVPHAGGVLYNPEGVGESHFNVQGQTHHPLYMLHPAEADDWIAKYGKDAKAVNKRAPDDGLVKHKADVLPMFAARIAESLGGLPAESPPDVAALVA